MRSPDRREHILSVAEELFATKGVASTTVRDIGDRAGVFSGSLYHYFQSKDAIVTEMLTRFIERVHLAYTTVIDETEPPATTLHRLIDATLGIVEDYPHPTAVWQNDQQYLRERHLLDELNRKSKQVGRLWYEVIGRGVEQGLLRDDLPVDVFYRSVRASVWQWHAIQWSDQPVYPRSELAEHLTRLFLDGFGTGRRRPAKSTAVTASRRRRRT